MEGRNSAKNPVVIRVKSDGGALPILYCFRLDLFGLISQKIKKHNVAIVPSSVV